MIAVEHLSKSFPKTYGVVSWLRHRGRTPRRPALRDVNLTVARGEVFGLVGPNGAGKTTLLKLIAALSLPDRGTIRVNGLDVATSPDAVKRHIGLCIAEERSFYYRLTVRQNLEFFGALLGLQHSALRWRIAAIAEVVDLARSLDLRFDALSSGMRQRLALARALLADPPILLADEPTRGVDPVHAEDIRKLLRDELAVGRGKTIIVATNLLDEAWSICDRMAVLSRGSVVHVGSPQGLEARLDRLLHYEINVDERLSEELLSRLASVEGVNRIDAGRGLDGFVIRIELRSSGRTLTDLLKELSGNGTLVRSIRPDRLRPLELFGEEGSDGDGD